MGIGIFICSEVHYLQLAMASRVFQRGASGLIATRPSRILLQRAAAAAAAPSRAGAARALHSTAPALTNFDAPFTTISQSGLSESQMDVRTAIQAITDRFDDAYWLEKDRTQTCEFCSTPSVCLQWYRSKGR